MTRRHWDTVRDCDRFRALATRDERLFLHLYFGTPHESFRAGLVRDFGESVEIPRSYPWELQGGGRAIDLVTGRAESSAPILKTGQVVHRVLTTLASDFYRPFRLATLFGRLYRGEFFNPTSSPLKVHQAMNRFKKWAKDAQFPIVVEEDSGLYRLAASAPCTLRVSGELREVSDAKKGSLVQLRAFIGPESEFSAQLAAETLGVSASTALRILERALAEGELERFGSGNKVRYRFLPRKAA